jgi:hypothetical protein
VCVCVCVCMREKTKGKTNEQTHTHTHTHTHTNRILYDDGESHWEQEKDIMFTETDEQVSLGLGFCLVYVHCTMMEIRTGRRKRTECSPC